MWQRFLERGGLWVVGQFVLMGLVFVAGWWHGAEAPPPWARVLGGMLMSVGAAFGISGAWVLGRNRTAYPKPNPGSEFVQRGIYRWVRHPLYSSLCFLSFGWAAWRGSEWALAAAVGLAAFLLCKARQEEQWLVEQFPEYEAYRRRVKRLIPWIF